MEARANPKIASSLIIGTFEQTSTCMWMCKVRTFKEVETTPLLVATGENPNADVAKRLDRKRNFCMVVLLFVASFLCIGLLLAVL